MLKFVFDLVRKFDIDSDSESPVKSDPDSELPAELGPDPEKIYLYWSDTLNSSNFLKLPTYSLNQIPFWNLIAILLLLHYSFLPIAHESCVHKLITSILIWLLIRFLWLKILKVLLSFYWLKFFSVFSFMRLLESCFTFSTILLEGLSAVHIFVIF